MVPDAHDKTKKHAPMMLTTDLSLRMDPKYGPISKKFHENLDEFSDAFARAWFKLTHRDMGPRACYLGPEVPKEELIWQDPVEKTKYKIKNKDINILKVKILKSGLSISQLVSTAWASASTFRGSDKRGGANGARIRLDPMRNWEANEPEKLSKTLKVLESIAKKTGATIADIIVLSGNVGLERAIKKGGSKVKVPDGNVDKNKAPSSRQIWNTHRPRPRQTHSHIDLKKLHHAETAPNRPKTARRGSLNFETTEQHFVQEPL